MYKNSEEKMKKLLIILLSAFLLSSCYLIPENLPTTIPASSTLIIGPSLSPEATDPPEPSETKTTIPTATLTTADTSIPAEPPTKTSTPQFTATSFPFIFQSGTPVRIENFAHPSEGCDWLGVAGHVFDRDGKPLMNKVVLVTGKIEGKVMEIVGVTGVSEANIYGSGGFEIVIADHIFASENELTIQIFDLDGIPISGSFPFDTLDDCRKNLIIINFQSAR